MPGLAEWCYFLARLQLWLIQSLSSCCCGCTGQNNRNVQPCHPITQERGLLLTSHVPIFHTLHHNLQPGSYLLRSFTDCQLSPVWSFSSLLGPNSKIYPFDSNASSVGLTQLVACSKYVLFSFLLNFSASFSFLLIRSSLYLPLLWPVFLICPHSPILQHSSRVRGSHTNISWTSNLSIT